jgi:16S rRNA (guanine527-N7)-methyltransferase
VEEILFYFPELNKEQQHQFAVLERFYANWNQKINVISRKDMDHFYERHVLHSLGIAKVNPFLPETKVLDVGTGGGFPGIPLAILFPSTHFYLIDSIGKKIKVVDEVIHTLGLKNVTARHLRAEEFQYSVDFVVSRAVTRMAAFVPWVEGKILKKGRHQMANGILYLKGGDLTEELTPFPKATIHPLNNYFNLPFFETKSVVHVPL